MQLAAFDDEDRSSSLRLAATWTPALATMSQKARPAVLVISDSRQSRHHIVQGLPFRKALSSAENGRRSGVPGVISVVVLHTSRHSNPAFTHS